MPLVSVIIPTYNCGKYIASAVESVLGQTFQDYEIIVMDDGSHDNTRQIIEPYRNRIRYFYQSNKGNSNARNEAFKKASGEYIAFLDADDRWKPNKLKVQISVLEDQKQIDFLFTNYDTIDMDGNRMDFSVIESGFPIFNEYPESIRCFFDQTKNINKLATLCGMKPNDAYLYCGNVFKYIFRGNFILPSTEIFRKRCLSTKIKFNESYRCASDQDFHLRFAWRHTFAYIDYPLVDYRVNRKDKLSGPQNTKDLIMNTIRSRLDMLREDEGFAKNNREFIKEAMARHYSRLAYYYLSVFQCKEAASYALKSLGYKPLQAKAWSILPLTGFPPGILRLAHKIKRIAV